MVLLKSRAVVQVPAMRAQTRRSIVRWDSREGERVVKERRERRKRFQRSAAESCPG
jgi:hypothetical protein